MGQKFDVGNYFPIFLTFTAVGEFFGHSPHNNSGFQRPKPNPRLLNEMDRIIGYQASFKVLRILYPDRTVEVRQIGQGRIDVIVSHANIRDRVGVALDQDTGRDVVVGQVRGGMQLVARDHIRMELGIRVLVTTDDDPIGIVQKGIVGYPGIADIAADTVVRSMWRPVTVGGPCRHTAV